MEFTYWTISSNLTKISCFYQFLKLVDPGGLHGNGILKHAGLHVSKVIPAANSLKGVDLTLEIRHPKYHGMQRNPNELRRVLDGTLSPMLGLSNMPWVCQYSISYPFSATENPCIPMPGLAESSKALGAVVRVFSL
jgi:hypothetical protein